MRRILLVLLCFCSSLAALAAERGLPPAAKPPMPGVRLAERGAAGQRAIELLGDRLPAVAAHYRSSPEALRQRLLHDPHLRIDAQGRLFVVEPLHAPSAQPSAPSPGLLDGTLAPLADTFKLHSRPGAKRTVYLDFVGGTVAATAWSSAGFQVQAMDLDGNPGSFSDAERKLVQGVWQRVAEDYSAFDVDITTEPPPADKLVRTNTRDDTFGMTVMITTEPAGNFLCGGCGGVAFVGGFDDVGADYTAKPAFVFHDRLANDEKIIAVAASHETGHTLGLFHDGTPWSAYYSGQGTGPTGWAPIMGLGYYQPLTQWSRSDYANANNDQDEVAVMQTFGLPLRADDHGDRPSSSTALKAATVAGKAVQAGQGVIERPDDVDMFSFSAMAGTVNVAVAPAAREANLDVLITLRNRAGTVLATANPSEQLGAALIAVLPAAGTYYVTVQGTGRGDPLVDGYSNYGSRGQYSVTVQQP